MPDIKHYQFKIFKKDPFMTSRSIIRFLVLSLLALAHPQVAKAQADAAGAEKLRATIQSMIDLQQRFDGAQVNTGSKVVYEGDIIIEPSGNFYSVTLPHLKYEYMGIMTFDVGKIAINASPHKDGQWKMTIATPTPMVLFAEDGTKSFEINIGGQSLAGIWDDKLMNFAKIDAKYSNITIGTPDSPDFIKIPEISIRYDFDKNAEGLWSGPGYISARDLTFTSTKNGSGASLSEIRYDFKMHDYNPAVMTEFYDAIEKIITLSDKSKKAVPADLNDPQAMEAYKTRLEETQKEVMAASGTFADVIGKIGDGFDSQYTIKGFKTYSPKATGEGNDSISFDEASFGFDISGLASDTMGMAMRFGYENFSMIPAPANLDSFVPTTLNFDINISKIPFQQLIQIAKDSIQQVAENPAAGQGIGLGLMFKLPQVLSQAGVQVDIENNYIGNDIYRAVHNGQMKADPSSISGFSGTGSFVFSGIDALSNKITAKMETADEKQKTQLFQSKSAIDQIKMFAKVETDENGKNKYIMNYELSPAGQLLINEQDMSGAIGLLMGGGPPPAVTTTTAP